MAGEYNIDDCSLGVPGFYKQDVDIKNWKQFTTGMSNDKYVGFITNDCIRNGQFNNYDCSQGNNTGEFEVLGRMESNKLQKGTNSNNLVRTDKQCTNKRSWCAAWNAQIACKKKDSAFTSIKTDTWKDCCKRNNINGLEIAGTNTTCHPKLYTQNGKFSDMCKNICLQNDASPKTIVGGASTTLKNDNQTCIDILANNNKDSYVREKLEEFCSSDVAYDHDKGEPVKEYTDVCGCYYPEDYYNNLVKKLKESYPNIPEHSYNDKTCFSTLCARSPLKKNISEEQCPDQYFLSCINNAEFEAGGDMSGIEVGQGNDCNIYVEKGEFPFCGRSCEKEGDCPGKCENCIDGKCKNEDSVSCSSYTCPKNKTTISNALCVGKSETCTETDCCIDTPGSRLSPNGPDTPYEFSNFMILLIILFIIAPILGGLGTFGGGSIVGAIIFLLFSIGFGVLLIFIDTNKCEIDGEFKDPKVKKECEDDEDKDKSDKDCLECSDGSEVLNKPFENNWFISCLVACVVSALICIILFAVYNSDSSSKGIPMLQSRKKLTNTL